MSELPPGTSPISGDNPGATEDLSPSDHQQVNLSPSVRRELEDALRANEGLLGEVFASYEQGLTSPTAIAESGVSTNPGRIGNLLQVVLAILEGDFPKSPYRAREAASSTRALIRRNPGLSEAARKWLWEVAARCDELAEDAQALAEEEEALSEQSSRVEGELAVSGGVYVYTLPHYWRYPYKDERHLFKVGQTDGDPDRRILAQAKTGTPERPVFVRLYRSVDTKSPAELEKVFHALLDAAGHERSWGPGRREWFATTTNFLDTIASVLGLDKVGSDEDVVLD